jgi:hypothetical protein
MNQEGVTSLGRKEKLRYYASQMERSNQQHAGLSHCWDIVAGGFQVVPNDCQFLLFKYLLFM